MQIDPGTMAYTVTIDASLQRTAGTVRTGTLVSEGNCSYASAESGAVFSFAPGGVLLGGVNAPSGGGFAPLLAFQNTFQNAAAPTEFDPVAMIFNAAGTKRIDGVAGDPAAYESSGRLRTTGTFQYCNPASGGFMVYDQSCAPTQKGYITYNAGRNAFDVFNTATTTTSGGTLAGSMVIGLVNGAAVPLHLVRETDTSVTPAVVTRGMRVLAKQQALASGIADGAYATASVKGENRDATVAGTSFNLGGVAATLGYNEPVIGAMQTDASRPGRLVFNSGILAFVTTDGVNAALELGVRH